MLRFRGVIRTNISCGNMLGPGNNIKDKALALCSKSYVVCFVIADWGNSKTEVLVLCKKLRAIIVSIC